MPPTLPTWEALRTDADAQHDREDDRCDHHLDQVDEAGAERLQGLAHLGEHHPTAMPRPTAMMTEM